MTNETETARATLADLEGKLAAAEARFIELEVERRRLSYDAAVSGGDAAKQLDKLTKESATASIVIANARSAVEEGKRRLAAAIRDEETAQDRANAAAALVIGDSIVEHARAIDAAFITAQTKMAAMKAGIDELHALGCVSPTSMQFLAFGGRAVSAVLMGLPVKADHGHLAPNERRTFIGLADDWRSAVARWANGFLVDGDAA